MKQLFLLLFISATSTYYSQIIYTSGNYASGNYSQQMGTVVLGAFGQNFDTTGANFTWDYSTIGLETTGNSASVTASSSGYQAAFTTQCILNGGGLGCLLRWNNLTNLGVLDLDSINAVVVTLYDIMTMAKKSTNALIGNVKGLKVKDSTGITIPLVAEYSVSDTILTFPFTYQDSGKSKGAWGLDASAIGQNIQYKVSYTRNWKVEGWGTLITPYQSHNNVLKVKTTLDQVDSVNYLGMAFGIPRTIVEYTWYDATFGLPVMKAEGLEFIGSTTINSVQYYDTRFAGNKEIVKKINLTLFPNPSSEIISIANPENIKITDYRVTDAQGKVVFMNSFSNSISVSTLKKGVYYIQLIHDNKIIGVEKFIKE